MTETGEKFPGEVEVLPPSEFATISDSGMNNDQQGSLMLSQGLRLMLSQLPNSRKKKKSFKRAGLKSRC